ncbi:hypothetical protein ACETK8_09450 [Brevundimonas staleyi]|uniref:Uncharacterized protein n=1 Tax=Brevundimonas staleyi TaxID=74326 RepID=A0ABW0FR61_9CAUL
MRGRSYIFPAFVALLLTAFPSAAQTETDEASEPPALVDELDSLCVEPAGDHVWTWSLARARGYVDLPPEEADGFRLWAFARELRTATRTVGGVEYRLMTAIGGSTPVGSNVLTDGSLVSLCWVSARPSQRGSVASSVRRYLGVGSFRVGDARIFPWIADGEARHGVRKVVFERRYHQLIREDHMEMISVANYGADWTILGYVRPRAPNATPDRLGRY